MNNANKDIVLISQEIYLGSVVILAEKKTIVLMVLVVVK
jgi:hypothetical protein